MIWGSILGVLPFTLALPHANLLWTGVLSAIIGLILASAFSAIIVYAQELVPGKVGMIAGLFFGFAFGIGGLGAAALGVLADRTSIDVHLPGVRLAAGTRPVYRVPAGGRANAAAASLTGAPAGALLPVGLASGLSSSFVQRLSGGASRLDGVAPPSNTPGILGRRALPTGRRAPKCAAQLTRTGHYRANSTVGLYRPASSPVASARSMSAMSSPRVP